MKYFVIFLVLVGFAGSVHVQSTGDTQDDMWLPACPQGSKTECDRSTLFHNAIAQPFTQSDSVVVGTIVQKENQKESSIRYSISVDFYLKNYQPFDLITAVLNNATEPQTFPDVLYYNSPVFNEGDLAFVYLKKSDVQYSVLPESFALDKQEVRGPPPTILLTKSPSEDSFEQGDEILVSGEVRKMELVKASKEEKQLDVKLMLHAPYDENYVVFSDVVDIDVDGSYNYSLDTSKTPPGKYDLRVNYGPSSTGDEITIEFNPEYWTPLKQIDLGIPFNEIQCKDGHVLIQKYDSSPACVKPETKQKLIERDWIEHKKNQDNTTTSFSFCGTDGFDSKGNPNVDNSTHRFDVNTCEWIAYSESEPLLLTQFEEIKNNIKKTQYSICNIQLEENKIIIHLNWIFEDTPQEETITSKIPSDVDYQIVYHEGYADYFINAITTQKCDSLDTIKSLMEKYDTVIEGSITWCMGHKTYPVRYQCDIQVDQYIEFDGERTGNLTILSNESLLINEKLKIFFGLDYHTDENYYELMATSIVANYNDFKEAGRPLENKN